VKVIIDTPIWSLALRRGADPHHSGVLADLSRRGAALILGAIRQEVLSGIREGGQFQFIRERLSVFPDVVLAKEDYETAAALYNRCRSRGVQGSNTDYLICAAATRRDLLVYTTDRDFKLYSRHLHVKLFRTHGSVE
jgi:predicted nucleic acid-binding protein